MLRKYRIRKYARKLRAELDAESAAMTDDELLDARSARADDWGERMSLETCLRLASVSDECRRRKESGRYDHEPWEWL